MLRRPSSSRRSRKYEDIDLPLVPILDAFVTLVAFLLMVTSLLAVTLIDTPVPVVSTTPQKLNKKPLSLTLKIREDGLRLESPFGLIKSQDLPRTEDDYPLLKLHDALLEVKRQYPAEKQLILMPEGRIKYDHIVKIMDAGRKINEGDESIYSKDDQGVDVVVTELFPDVVFGNVLTGGL